MPCVSDDKTNVSFRGKFDSCSNITSLGDVDCILNVSTEDALRFSRQERVTALICKPGRHNRRRRIVTILVMSMNIEANYSC